MSIETLLEAAKFLEWQALQQQKAREEDDLREKLRLNHEAEQKRAEVASLVQPVEVNHLTWSGRFCPEPCPTPVPPPAIPPPVPITVIPIPVLSASPKLLPTPAVTALTPLTDPRPSPPPAPPPQHQHLQLASQVKGESTALLQAPNPKQLLYPSPAPPASQHAPLPQPMPVQAPTSPTLQPAVTDDSRNLDAKRRPGGAGTREVHNKLEKNRRAHLKECFETLKKTVPTVDEKKTSNLSVLRSALRYIQTLKRKEKEYEHEMERLAREKISTQQRLAELKNELGQWMNVMEMERVLRLTAQPEDDQASTSTASEGEDNVDDNADEDHLQPPSKVPHMAQATPTAIPAQHQPPQPLVQLPAAPPAQSHAHTHVVTAASMPSVIAHASVIQAGSKHVAHLAPCSAPQAIVPAPCSAPQAIVSAPQATVSAPSSAPQPISHITVHPVAHLYPPTMMSHLAHTLTHAQVNTLTHAQVNTLTHAQVNTLTHAQVNALSHAQVNTLSPAQVNTLSHAQVNTLSHAQVNTLSHAQVNTLSQAQVNALTHAQVNCQPAVVTHHSQLVGQTVLNPVTMVTMPSFPVSTLKLA